MPPKNYKVGPSASSQFTSSDSEDSRYYLLMLFPWVKLVKFFGKMKIIFKFYGGRIHVIMCNFMQKMSMSKSWYTGAFSSFYIEADSRYREATETPLRVPILQKNYHKVLPILPKEME